MSEDGGPRVLEILGAEAGCKRLARDFYSRVAKDAELKPLFPGKSLRCATEEFAAFLIQLLDGDETQTQYRWWLSLRESHARFQISERQRAAWLSLMNETVTSSIKDSGTREAMSQFFEATSAYIVGKAEGELGHPELKHRWARQSALDQLIEDIANDRDGEAIARSRQFASRPSVFVGILARMMKAGREPFVEFVLESIQSDSQLRKSRFNGRTLLHFAAGSGCLPIVRKLLAIGVDPDILDLGGHAPLYRAAGAGNRDQGATIVRELVRAGATVDHGGGVTKSTALHEAARHGNLQVAKALLDAGASLTARDKKGFTPLERAINCRRHDVAALLASR